MAISTSMKICVALAFLLTMVSITEGGVLLSSLNKTLVVEARIKEQNATTGVAQAGEDHLVISWHLNSSLPISVGEKYVNVKLRLCYEPLSTVDRKWRKAKDDLHKDKACQKGIAVQKYIISGNTTTWRITKDVPGATYFVRAYAVNANGTQLAFGQTSNKEKTTNLITVTPISGRHASIDVAAAIFSVFSVGSLAGFLGLEAIRSKRNAK